MSNEPIHPVEADPEVKEFVESCTPEQLDVGYERTCEAFVQDGKEALSREEFDAIIETITENGE